ncbi:MAG: glycosyltransferase family 2 protein [Candidatus Bathyarchaeota archaeon]|nr:glycosyltransferase family 2 protein [Candidatus Bathyarchaeota archaeon]
MKSSFSDDSKMIAIIPCCNNTRQLLCVLSNFKEKSVNEICVVIDRATNRELDQLENVSLKVPIPVSVISRHDRRGIGSAIRDGIEYAIRQKYDVAVIMAGNDKDQPSEINRLLMPILRDKFDYVQGSRFLNGGKCVKNPFLRGMFSRLYPFVWTLLTKSKCTDVTNGFRAYKLSLFNDQKIDISQSWLDGYELEYYIHYKALTLGYRTKEVPVSKVYPFRHKGGYSNISPFHDWWQIVGPLFYLKTGVRK